MQITNTNLAMVRGDSEILTVSCTDSTGVAMPFVTGDTVYFTVKEKSSFTQKKIQKVITTFTDGKAIIDIDPLDTKSLEFKPYVYDVQLTRDDLSVKTIIPTSVFEIKSEVTYE